MARSKPKNTAMSEFHIWRAVITQAIADATNKSMDRRELRARDEARQWFQDDSADFRRVCVFADLEPDAVRACALDLIDKHDSNTVQRPSPPPKPARERISLSALTDRNGTTLSIQQWAERTGISQATLYHRIHSGWPLDEALTTIPVRGRRPKRPDNIAA